MPGAVLCEQHLRANRHDLVPDGRAQNGVLTVHDHLLGHIARAEGIEVLVLGHVDRVRVDQAVLVAADGRVNSHVEKALVIKGHDTITEASRMYMKT